MTSSTRRNLHPGKLYKVLRLNAKNINTAWRLEYLFVLEKRLDLYVEIVDNH